MIAPEKPDGQFESHRRALRSEVSNFCRDARLTPRETEIVRILALGLVRIRDIASQLELSPNTVNNHVNSIFLKTKTRSKSELLAMLLERLAHELRWARLMRSSPRVLHVSSSPSSPTRLAETLDRLRKWQFLIRSTGQDYQSHINEFSPDVVIFESNSDSECAACLQGLAEPIRAPAIFYLDSVADEIRARMMELGAMDCVEYDFAAEALALVILSHRMGEEVQRTYVEFEFGTAPIASKICHVFEKSKWGTGGVFLSSAEVKRIFLKPIERGDWVEFPVDFQNGRGEIDVRGQVVWTRSDQQGQPGVGIRVLGLTRHVPQAANNSYIPSGLAL